MAPTPRPAPRPRTVEPAARPVASRRRPTMPALAPGVFPLVVFCSLVLSAGMAFGNPTLWTTFDQRASDTPADVAAAADQEAAEGDEPAAADGEAPEPVVRGEYQAVSQSEDPGRRENIRLGAEAIDGVVIQPGEEFSFNDVVGDTTSENGYQEAPVINNGEVAQGDGGGVCQVSTALYNAAVKADLEITERHPHSVPSDYAPIGLDATIVYGTFDLRIRNNTDHPVTIHAKAVGQTVDVSITGDPLPEGLTVDATSHVVSQYHRDNGSGHEQQYYVTESFKVYYQDGERTTRDLLSSDIYLVEDGDAVVMAEGSVDPNK
ncbi:MAG: VanW family protein [Adlercreutzia sp.]|nr:VanW family protein [Adlercreutzia sp.]